MRVRNYAGNKKKTLGMIIWAVTVTKMSDKNILHVRQNPLYKKKLLLHKEEFSLTHGVPKAFISKRPFQRLWLLTNHYFAFCLSPTVRSPQGDVDPSGWSRPHQSVSVLDSVSQASSPHQSPLWAYVPQKSKTDSFVIFCLSFLLSKSRQSCEIFTEFLVKSTPNILIHLIFFIGWWRRSRCDHLHSLDFGENLSPD